MQLGNRCESEVYMLVQGRISDTLPTLLYLRTESVLGKSFGCRFRLWREDRRNPDSRGQGRGARDSSHGVEVELGWGNRELMP